MTGLTTNSWLAILIVMAVIAFATWTQYTGNNGSRVTAFAQSGGDVNQYMTFESPAGTDYQVPAGTTLKIAKLVFQSATANAAFVIGYGDDAVALGGSAPTNPVSVIGVAGSPPVSPVITNEPGDHFELDVYAEIPASTYPFLQASASSSAIQIFAREE